MDPRLATLIFAILILGLFHLERDPKARTSKALWLPVLWLLISSSRNVGEWVNTGAPLNPEDQYLNGNPLDRNVLGVLLALGLIVLVARRRQVSELLRANKPVLLYFFYCGVSILWSAYPFVAFKRWNRALGDVVMALVILTDPDRLSALKRVLARVGFLVLPLSVLLIRYYPDLGRSFGYDGTMYWTGVTETKNGLGVICVVFGLGSLWRCLEVNQGREDPQRTRRLIAHGTIVITAMWLLWQAHSMTSTSCFLLASGLMVATSLRVVARKPTVVYLLVAATVGLSAFVLFSGSATGLLTTMGRNPDLTGRTEVWKIVLRVTANPLFGAGYESFWLGERLLTIRSLVGETINQCHNGYLEIYVNLGWIGLTLLALIIATSCRKVVLAVRQDPAVGRLRLAYFLVGVIFNFTEAGFKMMCPVWIFFLLAAMAVPRTPVPEGLPAIGGDLTGSFADWEPQAGYVLDAGLRAEAL